MIEVRRAATDSDLEGWIRVKRAVLPNESAWTVEEFKTRMPADRAVFVAELDGEIVGAGLGGRSDDPQRGFVTPRVHPDARRRGVGTLLLRECLAFVEELGFGRVSGQVTDPGSREFAERFGFVETDRQVEQVRRLDGEIALDPLPDGVEVVTIAERPDLLEAAYPLARDEGYTDLALEGVDLDPARRVAPRRGDAARRLVRRARRRRDRRLLRPDGARQRGRRRGRAHGRRARLAPSRPRQGAQAARARLGRSRPASTRW